MKKYKNRFGFIEMNKSFFFLLCFFSAILSIDKLSAKCMGGKTEDILDDLKSRKLIVVIETEDPDVVKDIAKGKRIPNKETALPNYKKYIEEYNQNMKAVVDKFWKIPNKGIEYKTYKEVMELNKEGSAGYAVLYCGSRAETGSIAQPSTRKYVNTTSLYYDPFDVKTEDVNRNRHFNSWTNVLTLVRIKNLYRPIYTCAMQDKLPTKADILLGIQNLETTFEARSKSKTEEKKSPKDAWYVEFDQLSKKTLLIREDLLDSKIKKEQLSSLYPNKYEVVSKEKYDEIFFNQTSGYAVVFLQPLPNRLPEDEVLFLPSVVDSENGKYITVSEVSQMRNSDVVTKRVIANFLAGPKQ